MTTEEHSSDTGGTLPDESFSGESFAAVDLGSNSFHLIVARYSLGQLTVLDRLREMVQLAAGLDKRNRLDAECQQRALECLSRFGQRLRDIPPENLRVVGTNTLRKARDSGAFMEAAREELGHSIDTISGIEEARLVYLGAVSSLPATEGKLLVVDIGGGSTEIIVGQDASPITLDSLYMGCVSYTKAYFPNGKLTRRRFQKARMAARSELRSIAANVRRHEWSLAVGTSGTVRAVASVLRDAGLSEEEITLSAMKKLMRQLIKAGHIDAVELPGLSEQRASVFAGGLAILMEVFAALGIDRMAIAEGSLREGILYDLIGRYEAHDARFATVESMMARYHVDVAQAERVRDTSLKFLDEVGKSWGLKTEECRDLLYWAASLHEIGLDIAHSQYQRHGAYLIKHSDLSGFTQREQTLLSILVGLHRRKIDKDQLDESGADRKQIVRLLVLLRLSVVLHRSRMPDQELPVTIKARSSKVTLCYPNGWLRDNPLTRTDLAAERRHLKSIGMRLRVQSVKD